MTRKQLEELVDDIAAIVIAAETADSETIRQLEQILGRIEGAAAEHGIDVLAETRALRQIFDTAEEETDGDAHLQTALTHAAKIQSILKIGGQPPAPSPESNADGNAERSPWLTDEGDDTFALPDYVDEEVFREFLSNFGHVLEDIEEDILLMEKGNQAAKPDLKRRIHSLKGEAGVLSLDDIEMVCHAVEDLLGEHRSPRGTTDLLLETVDWMRKAGNRYAEFHQPSPRGEYHCAYLKKRNSDILDAAPRADEASTETEEKDSSGAEGSGGGEAAEFVQVEWDDETVALVGEFLEESEEGLSSADQILMNIDHSGMEPEKVNALFRTFHTIKGVSGFLELSEITRLAHTTETMLDQVRDGKFGLDGAVLDLVFDSTELMRRMLKYVRDAVENGGGVQSERELSGQIAKLESVINGEQPSETPSVAVQPGDKLGEILVKSHVPPGVVDAALQAQKETGRPLGEELVAQGNVKPKEVSQALRAQRAASEGASVKIKETVKVDLERVDRLVEMIGELVIVESMVVHADEINSLPSPKVRTYLSQLEKITRDLQDTGMRMRMVPVRGVFQKMARMVRDLARKSGKSVRMVTSGEGTEMDRSMVEQITDPLVHMIRNAVDHAIEPSERRKALGKPGEGEVHLSAYHEGGSIIIEIADDGKGLDRDAILEKAVRQGLVVGNEPLTDSDVYKLIFAPGFSTAAKVTEISGRGVGMDVVRRNIESMRGRISIESEKGKGTTFKLILPLTLAIIDGMLVSCGPEKYIVPTLSIVESLQVTHQMVKSFADKGELINVRGEIFPLIRMDMLFCIDGAKKDSAEGLVVVLEGVGKKVGLFVDEVLTQQQVVIKSLGNGIQETPYISGGAIMSDGTVGLILNVEEIAALVDKRASKQLDYAATGGAGGIPSPGFLEAKAGLEGATSSSKEVSL